MTGRAVSAREEELVRTLSHLFTDAPCNSLSLGGLPTTLAVMAPLRVTKLVHRNLPPPPQVLYVLCIPTLVVLDLMDNSERLPGGGAVFN